MAAPTVQSVQDIIAQLTAAYKPTSDMIDTSIAANAASGSQQEQGLAAKKDTAFGQITQQGQNRGMLFSGFSPDAQAKYTAGTYLPALAALQGKIADVRSSLLGKKADLSTQANTQAFNLHNQEQSDYDKYIANLEAEARAAQQHAADQAFTASENSKSRAASARASAGPSPAQQKVSDIAAAHNFLQGLTGSDGRVSPTTYSQAKSLWGSMGYSTKEFDSNFAAYRNPNNKYYKLG